MLKNTESSWQERDVDAHAGLYFRDAEASNVNGYGNALLRHELARRGVGTYILSGAESFDFEANSARVFPTVSKRGSIEMSLGDAQLVPLTGGLDVVRARVLTPRSLDERLPVLNGSRLRALGASKWEQYGIASDVMPRTVLLDRVDQVTDATLEPLEGDTLVVKADLSQAGQHIKVVPRSEVPLAVLGIREEFSLQELRGKARSNHRILIQEYAPGRAMQGLIATNQEAAETLARAASTELRVYCFVDGAGKVAKDERYYATARAFAPIEPGSRPTDDWVPIDQASVPDAAWRVADAVSDRVLKKTGVHGGFFAIDLIEVAGKDGTSRMMVREINTRDPMMLVESQDQTDARVQRERLANVMSILARNASQISPNKA